MTRWGIRSSTAAGALAFVMMLGSCGTSHKASSPTTLSRPPTGVSTPANGSPTLVGFAVSTFACFVRGGLGRSEDVRLADIEAVKLCPSGLPVARGVAATAGQAGLGSLLAALSAGSVAQTPGCVGQEYPYFLLAQTRSGALYLSIPRDACGEPQAAAKAAIASVFL